MDTLTMIGVGLGCVFLAVGVFCAFKESSVTGTYKAFGVYGRIKAYLALDLVLGGISLPIISFVPLYAYTPLMKVGLIVGGIVAAACGILIYVYTYRKCPDFLKKRCIPCMIITGLGVAVKIALFFIGSIWKLITPEEVFDSQGNSLYVYGGTAYDHTGQNVGTVSGSQFTPNSNYKGQ